MQRGVTHHGGKKRRLADAVAADHADAFARRDRQIDVFDHDGLAVAGRDRFERKRISHGWPARETARTSALVPISFGVPCAKIAPRTSTVMYWAKRNTRSMS